LKSRLDVGHGRVPKDDNGLSAGGWGEGGREEAVEVRACGGQDELHENHELGIKYEFGIMKIKLILVDGILSLRGDYYTMGLELSVRA
jgi:hypothetical protein